MDNHGSAYTSTYTYTYDAYGNVLTKREVNSWGRDITYTYDAYGNAEYFFFSTENFFP